MAKRKAPYGLLEAKYMIHHQIDKIRELNPWHDPEHAHLWASMANILEAFATVIREDVPNCPAGTFKLMKDEEPSTTAHGERRRDSLAELQEARASASPKREE